MPLAETQRKRPRTTDEAETTTGTEQSATLPEVAGSSPPCEVHVQFLPVSATIESSTMEIDKGLESGQPEGERQEMEPLTAPSTSEPSPRLSSARISPPPEEPLESLLCIGVPPATNVVGD